MPSPTLNALFLFGSFVLSTGAMAQTVYKCGDSYSQTPCSGGIAIDAFDPRSSEQKMQADAATRRDARTADAMEQARLAQEKKDLAANTPPLQPARVAKANKVSTSKIKKKKRKPAHGTVQVPDRKKTTVKQDERRS